MEINKYDQLDIALKYAKHKVITQEEAREIFFKIFKEYEVNEIESIEDEK